MTSPRLLLALLAATIVTSASAQMPDMPGMDMGPAAAPVAPLTRPEPAGSVPDLLGNLAARPALTLDEILTLADANNPTLKQAQALIRRTQAQARQAALYPNPTIGYQGEQIRGGSYGGGEQGGFIAQTIPLGGKLGLRTSALSQQAKVDALAAQTQTLRVHNDVAQAFYAALAAQKTAEIRRQMLRLAEDTVETAHQLANVGQSEAPEVLQAEIDLEQSRIDDEHAQRLVLARFAGLAALAGQPGLIPRPLAASFDDPPHLDAANLLASLLAQSPATAGAAQQIAVAEAQLKAARRESIPDLTLKAGAQQNLERLPESPNKATGLQSFASAGITLPLWNRNQGGIQAAEAELEGARQDVVRSQLALRRQAEPLLQQYLSASFEAERYKTQLIPRATRAYDLYLQKYKAMASPYAPALSAQRMLLRLQLSYIAALGATWQSAVALRNFTLTGALNSPSPAYTVTPTDMTSTETPIE